MAEELRKISPEELKQILAEHRKWLYSDKKEGKQADLSGANLRGAKLEGFDLVNAYPVGVGPRKANLKGATFNNTKTDLTVKELKRREAIVK